MCCSAKVSEIVSTFSRRELLQAIGLTAAATPAAAAEPPAIPRIRGSRLADLTHTLTPDFPIIPVPGLTFPIRIEPIATVKNNGVFSNKWELIEHNGTHVDAPCHFHPEGASLDQMPLSEFIAPLAILDLTARAARDRDAALVPDDVLAWEKRHGRLPAGAAVFLHSGWDQRTGSSADYLNMDSTGTLHFPGFSTAAIEFLTTERRISGVGVDTISFDIGPDKEYRAHKALFRAGKWGVECVRGLASLPPSGATVIVAAPKVIGASGAPARVFAIW